MKGGGTQQAGFSFCGYRKIYGDYLTYSILKIPILGVRMYTAVHEVRLDCSPVAGNRHT